ncbi:MAG: LON peptidase substrate-binding domain-containing protein, partial [Bacteroidetes bacterium]|nr:LON peptidase substrate-binding domain-containing protein [Bacteroidota bacterium]
MNNKGIFELIADDSMNDDNAEFISLISSEEEEEITTADAPEILPILPLKNTVLFPGVVIPLTVGRDKSIKLIQDSYKGDKTIGVVAQQSPDIEDPSTTQLNQVGTLARIVKMLRMPDGNTMAIIQGKRRIKIDEYVETEPYFKAKVSGIIEPKFKKTRENEALFATMKDLAKQIINLSPNIPSEAVVAIKNIDSPTFMLNFISSNLNVTVEDKQRILEIVSFEERSQRVLEHMTKELQMLEVKSQIQDKVKGDIDKQQREYFLQQQMKAIQEELGNGGMEQEIADLKKRALEKQWQGPVAETFEKEIQKLQRMNPAAAEYSVIYNYLELLLDL